MGKSISARKITRGNGNLAEELISDASALGLGNVEFENCVPKGSLNASVAAADIHLVPQLPEGAEFAIPRRLFSIMSSGRPFICAALPDSPLGGPARKSEAFVITPLSESKQFADRISELLNDPEALGIMGKMVGTMMLKTWLVIPI